MIYKIFLKTAKNYPDHIALKTSTGEQYTYQELLNTTQQWINYLIELGVKKGQRVGCFSIDHDWHCMIYLALDGMGACYVAMDPNMPLNQLQNALRVLHLDHFFTTDNTTLEKNKELTKTTLFNKNEPINYSSQRLSSTIANTRADITYLGRTSGSTGSGEGKYFPIGPTSAPYSGYEYWIKFIEQTMDLHADDRICSTRDPCFDARLFEYLCAWAFGGALYLMDSNKRKDLSEITKLCEKEGITFLLMVPSQLERSQFNSLIPRLAKAGLVHLIVTGEACSWELAKICVEAGLKNFNNCFGPSELMFGVSALNIVEYIRSNPNFDEQSPVPIGKPMLPVTYEIENGKLVIHSPFRTSGYLGNHPPLEGDRFDTGDLFDERDGYLYYLGRDVESTHKIGGEKVSPIFVEELINRYAPDKLQSIVVAKPWQGRLKLVAYIKSTITFDQEQFLSFLKDNLTNAQFPVCFTIDEYPRLSTSDKIDRKRLAQQLDYSNELFFNSLKSSDTSTEPLLEDMITIWRETFNVEAIHADSNFLALGGDSITAVELIKRIQTVQPNFDLTDFLSLNLFTPRELAKKIMNHEHNLVLKPALSLLVDNPSEEAPFLFLIPHLYGEGCFSYIDLADTYNRFNHHVKCKLIGITIPNGLIPESLEEEAILVVNAILAYLAGRTNPIIKLLGFSYGSTLAYAVVKEMHRRNIVIKSLDLVDGFSPLLVQKITAESHAKLLFSMLHFTQEFLAKSPYNERIELPSCIIDNNVQLSNQLAKEYAKTLPEVQVQAKHFIETKDYLDKLNQIRYFFGLIAQQVSSTTSKHIIQLAEQHLLFMLNDVIPESPINLAPTFYQSDLEQPYWQVSNSVKRTISRAPVFRNASWLPYFEMVKRNNFEAKKVSHLGLLQDKSSAGFWQWSDNPLHHVVDSYGPFAYYTVKTNHHGIRYDIQYLRLSQKNAVLDKLKQLKIVNQSLDLDINHELYHNLSTAESLCSIIIRPTAANEQLLKDYLKSIHICEQVVEEPELVGIPLETKPKICYFTIKHYNHTLLDIALKLPNQSQKIPKQLAIPKNFIQLRSKTDPSILWFGYVDTNEGTVFDSIRAASAVVGQFVSAINLQLNAPIAEKPPYIRTPKISPALSLFSNKGLEQVKLKYKLPNLKQKNIEKALRMAACNGQKDDLELLISLVKNINARDSNPKILRSALHWATLRDHRDCAIMLIQAGADVNLFDAEFKTALP